MINHYIHSKILLTLISGGKWIKFNLKDYYYFI